jgi:hypothetical protein
MSNVGYGSTLSQPAIFAWRNTYFSAEDLSEMAWASVTAIGMHSGKVSCFDAGVEPGAAEPAFFDRGGSRENPYYARLGDRGVNDALLNPRLRVDPNQQILPPCQGDTD